MQQKLKKLKVVMAFTITLCTIKLMAISQGQYMSVYGSVNKYSNPVKISADYNRFLLTLKAGDVIKNGAVLIPNTEFNSIAFKDEFINHKTQFSVNNQAIPANSIFIGNKSTQIPSGNISYIVNFNYKAGDAIGSINPTHEGNYSHYNDINKYTLKTDQELILPVPDPEYRDDKIMINDVAFKGDDIQITSNVVDHNFNSKKSEIGGGLRIGSYYQNMQFELEIAKHSVKLFNNTSRETMKLNNLDLLFNCYINIDFQQIVIPYAGLGAGIRYTNLKIKEIPINQKGRFTPEEQELKMANLSKFQDGWNFVYQAILGVDVACSKKTTLYTEYNYSSYLDRGHSFDSSEKIENNKKNKLWIKEKIHSFKVGMKFLF